eukprot:TRINITY_DN22269_c0_g1_i2.p1 TRINITY_DN22269_c0_g1~~TRINITY_DN22269_c0_g1_i2.p1  ORF type:complete len:407 (+),score=33.95 TRINITY_DN22269_c0_g1_i2:81-1301(+)
MAQPSSTGETTEGWEQLKCAARAVYDSDAASAAQASERIKNLQTEACEATQRALESSENSAKLRGLCRLQQELLEKEEVQVDAMISAVLRARKRRDAAVGTYNEVRDCTERLSSALRGAEAALKARLRESDVHILDEAGHLFADGTAEGLESLLQRISVDGYDNVQWDTALQSQLSRSETMAKALCTITKFCRDNSTAIADVVAQAKILHHAGLLSSEQFAHTLETLLTASTRMEAIATREREQVEQHQARLTRILQDQCTQQERAAAFSKRATTLEHQLQGETALPAEEGLLLQEADDVLSSIRGRTVHNTLCVSPEDTIGSIQAAMQELTEKGATLQQMLVVLDKTSQADALKQEGRRLHEERDAQQKSVSHMQEELKRLHSEIDRLQSSTERTAHTRPQQPNQ